MKLKFLELQRENDSQTEVIHNRISLEEIMNGTMENLKEQIFKIDT